MARTTMVSGYEVVYSTPEGLVVHGDCASDLDTQVPYWEGPPIECDCLDQCGRMLVSAYGEVQE